MFLERRGSRHWTEFALRKEEKRSEDGSVFDMKHGIMLAEKEGKQPRFMPGNQPKGR